MWYFLRLRSGPLPFFLGLIIWPHLHIPVTNAPEYPSPMLGERLEVGIRKPGGKRVWKREHRKGNSKCGGK